MEDLLWLLLSQQVLVLFNLEETICIKNLLFLVLVDKSWSLVVLDVLFILVTVAVT
jgi:hypothetical protein